MKQLRSSLSLAIGLVCSLTAMSSYAQSGNLFNSNNMNRLYMAELDLGTEVSPNQLSSKKSASSYNSAKSDDKTPYAESHFLEHVGNVELLFGVTQHQATTSTSSTNSFIVGDGFKYANKNKPLLLGSRLAPLETKYDLSEDKNQESDIFSVGLGMFIKKGMMVGFKYDRTTSRIYKDLAQIDTVKSDQYDFFTKFVHQLDNGRAFNIEASYAIDSAVDNTRGDNQTFNISGDFYVNPKNSIGFGIERITSEENFIDGNVMSFEMRSYITPKFSVAAGLERYSSDNIQFIDDQTIDINFNAQF